MIVTAVDGNIIGDIERGVFTKRVHGKAHMLQTPPAWSIDAIAFNQKVAPFSNTIRIEDLDSKIVYQISTKTFEEKMVRMDRQFGAQVYVVLKHWQQITPNQAALL